ncbi:MAG: hypothetical protein Q8W45_05935 [Candidatus Palauibacterales bacterium]|nr:hypothetical protein [Candidatus Palauibacterales bacterium]
MTPRPPLDGAFHVYGGAGGEYRPPGTMAEIQESPEARERVPVPLPRWVVFVDLTGSRVRLRTALIEFVEQCTAEQRRIGRAMNAALKAEGKAQEWEQDD